MYGKMSKISCVLAFLMFFSFGTSAFASNGTTTNANSVIAEDVLLLSEIFEDVDENQVLAEGNTIVQEFIDEEGQNNELVIEMEAEQNVVSLFVDGELEQQSTASKDTGTVTGFSDYGEVKFEKNVSDLVAIEDAPTEDDGLISAAAVGTYSNVASRKSVANSLCPKTVTAYLYEKRSTTYSKKTILSLSRGEVLTAVVATIVTAVVLKSKPSVTLLKEAFTGVGISIVAGALYSGFKGSYQVRSEIRDYYATISGSRHFTNKITNEYFTLWNTYNGKTTTKFLGEHISAYGKPKTFQTMLSQAIVNWSKGPACK